MKNGSILVGDVGSGKSRTALYYYISKVGKIDLYIITTAKKRDSKEWVDELKAMELMDIYEKGHVHIDSWNNIKKYVKVTNAFFIFDEQRVVGKGSWVKAFLKITRSNKWILLSATPGDSWQDYIPVFLANGFYRNRTEFNYEHVIFNPYCTKYPQIDRYINTSVLNKHRRDILVQMKDSRKTKRNDIQYTVEYCKSDYKRIWCDRWDIYDDEPIKETGKLCYLMRKVVNSDKSRLEALRKILAMHPKAIIFYNFNYELNMMKTFLESMDIPYSEWNGQKHEDILVGNKWVYLVQYTAGAEGWNCITTDTMIFYSQTYSYRSKEQAAGRIDRMNSPFTNLYYYHLVSYAPIDIAIKKALKSKKSFNERNFVSRSPVSMRVSSCAK